MVYLPPHFAMNDQEAMHQLIRDVPLGTLVTLGPDGLTANHIPFVLDSTFGDHGRLLGHVARQNEVWTNHSPEHDVLIVFQSVDAYITPNWYVTKQKSHEVVPTWNYCVVHVYGKLIVHDDVKWVRGQAGRLTKQQEATQPISWKLADAPPAFVSANLEQIVGIEIPIARLVGKAKASQNRQDVDRDGAIAGLRETGEASKIAMAELINRLSKRD